MQEHPLRRYRDEHELTLEQMAAKIGDISGVSISRIESWQQRPTHKLLLKISRVTGIPVEQLLVAA